MQRLLFFITSYLETVCCALFCPVVSDFPSSPQDTISSLVNLDFTNPQENLRIGKFMNFEKTFSVEFSLDHTKYNTDLDQTAAVRRTINSQPSYGDMVLNT